MLKNLCKMRLHKFHWFIIGVTICKVVLMGLFSSDYQNQMFMPFVETFITNDVGFNNPYEYYYLNNLIPSFPYPPLMLFIQSIGGVLVHLFNNAPIFILNILFKIPNLIFDYIGMYYLMRLFPDKRRYIGILYFASPIILYSTYMHGQLDIIPTAILVVAIYHLIQKSKRSRGIALVMLGLALATKLHILAILPILFLYALKRDGVKRSLEIIIIPIGLALFIMLPFLSKGFIEGVIFNQEQKVLTQVYVSFVNIKIYIPILAIIFVYFKAFSLSNINKELLISFCGVLFAVFLALVPPMPGWYVWIVPFVTVFFINFSENKYKNITIYVTFNVLYVIYFIFLHKTDYIDLYLLNKNLSDLKINNEVMRNTAFTLLAGCLCYTTFLMYQLGIKSNSLYKRKNLPFTIGITGDSGSGKTTSMSLLESILNKKNMLFIEGDGDHRWERGDKRWKNYTHLNPKANYLYKQALDIEKLRIGASVKRVEYDHNTGKFSHEQKIQPNKYIILCGLHSFYLPQLRKVLDLKIYMNTDEVLRRYWKIQRDVTHRGYTKEKIIEQIESRMPDAYKYIIPQKEYADLVIRYFDYNLEDCCVDNYQVTVSLQITISASINLEPLMKRISEFDIRIKHDYSEDLQQQTVEFDGSSLIEKKIDYNYIAGEIIPQIDELCNEEIYFQEKLDGIIQLFILILISTKMQGEI